MATARYKSKQEDTLESRLAYGTRNNASQVTYTVGLYGMTVKISSCEPKIAKSCAHLAIHYPEIKTINHTLMVYKENIEIIGDFHDFCTAVNRDGDGVNRGIY